MLTRTPSRPRTIVLFGYLGGRNLGDDAMLAGLFASTPADTRFVVLARDPAAVERPPGRDVKVQSAALRGALRAIMTADGVVRVGGTSFHDEYSGSAARRMAWKYIQLALLFAIPRLLGKEVAAFGVGAGRMSRWSTRLSAHVAMAACRSVVVRDEASARLYRPLAGRKLVEGVDLAFLGGRPQGVEIEPDLLGVSVLDLEPYRPGVRDEEAFWRQLILTIAARRGARRLRIFVFKDNEGESDAPLAERLAIGLAGAFDEIRLVRHADGVERVKVETARCATFVATRYHSAIFAAVAGVEQIIVPYNDKLNHFAADVGLPATAVVDFDRALDAQPLAPAAADLSGPKISARLTAARRAIDSFFRDDSPQGESLKQVLCVIHAPRWGGIHTIMERVAPICEAKGWRWTVLLPETKGENGRKRLEAAGVQVVDIPLRRIRKTLNPMVQLGFLASIPLDIFRLMQVIRREKIDVVQVCGLMHFHSAVAGRLMGKAVVWQMHSDQPPRVLKRFFTPWVRQLANAAMTAGHKIIPKHPRLSEMGDRLSVFFAPVDMQRYRPDEDLRRSARKLYGAAEGDIVVGTAGGRGPNKNHALLVEVAELLRDRHPNLKFAICGHWLPQHRAYYESEVIGRAEKSGLIDSGVVRFYEPGSKVEEYLPGMDIFALPSHGEGISVVTGEAMAAALPVVVNDVGSMADFVQDGVVGYLNRSCTAAEMAEHISRLCSDANLRHQMGAAALAYARQHLDQAVCADVHVAAYHTAIEHLGGTGTGA